jgi:hypothetical protein
VSRGRSRRAAKRCMHMVIAMRMTWVFGGRGGLVVLKGGWGEEVA